MPFSLEVFSDNPYASNCWLLSSEGRTDAVVVDPGFSAERVRGLLAAAGKRPVAVLATHGHSDHVGAAAEMCGSDLPLYIHREDEPALTDQAAWGAGFPSVAPGRPDVVRPVEDRDVIDEAGFQLEVVHTPGHTPGSVCFRFDGSVFTGDLVFRGSIGRSDFPNSSPERMVTSLRRFLELPDGTAVYPGHMEPTSVGAERATNPFLVQLV